MSPHGLRPAWVLECLCLYRKFVFSGHTETMQEKYKHDGNVYDPTMGLKKCHQLPRKDRYFIPLQMNHGLSISISTQPHPKLL